MTGNGGENTLNESPDFDVRVLNDIVKNNLPFMPKPLNPDIGSDQDKTMMVSPNSMNSQSPALAVMIGHSSHMNSNVHILE
jgi:hypothetical protein